MASSSKATPILESVDPPHSPLSVSSDSQSKEQSLSPNEGDVEPECLDLKRKTKTESDAMSNRERSEVWNHFEKYMKPIYGIKDGKRCIINEVQKARCVYCRKEFACSSTINGTSSLRRHIEKVCKKYPGRLDLENSQKVFTKGGSLYNPQLSMVAFDQELCLKACVEMIVIDELSFTHPKKKGFQRFCRAACPRFAIPDRKLVVSTFWNLYKEGKTKLKQELASHCMNLTTDTWTSVQNINYMVITAHFIDDGWNLHKRILNFREISNHQGNTIGKLLESSLLEWGIERVMTISVDNASANKVAIEYLRERMMEWKIKPLFGGRYLHVRCLAHILNLIVNSGLKMMEKSISSIRNAVRYVRSSPARLEMFKQCVESAKLDSKKVCILDVPTRWNSTFLMLDVALELRKAFDRMQDEDDVRYLNYFDEDDENSDDIEASQATVTDKGNKQRRKRMGPPMKSDWERATVFVNFLKVFYDVTLRISATNSPTAHKAFHDVVAIQMEIEDLFSYNSNIGENPSANEEDHAQQILLQMAHKMKNKFSKYFGRLEDMNQLLLVALILDPRYKLWNFESICKNWLQLDNQLLKQKSDELKELLVSLTDHYATYFGTRKGVQAIRRGGNGTATNSGRLSMMSGKMAALEGRWKQELEDSDQVIIGHEVDRYLMDPIEDPPVGQEWDLLLWWKLNGSKYPNLSLVAKDVLSIQVSTVASESCFSTGKRVINPHRSSLSPKTIEGLICFQNWLKCDDVQEIEYVPTPEDMIFYEKAEKEAINEDIAYNAVTEPIKADKGKMIASPSPKKGIRGMKAATSRQLIQQAFQANGSSSPASKRKRKTLSIN